MNTADLYNNSPFVEYVGLIERINQALTDGDGSNLSQLHHEMEETWEKMIEARHENFRKLWKNTFESFGPGEVRKK